jgi:transcription-repair coupling factor (superfamily II helicase)
MQDFENKKFNILLSTSIIESGIHLPNVNTIIVDGANNFGIADLHQLRGRVGRGTKEGYCYFLVEDKELLSPESTKRLLALENNSELGSGHALAYQDLEIRGGGNILGAQQSGHIKNIGYSMYLRMLEEAINLLSGTIDEDRKKDVDIKLSISAFISTELISEDRIRLELYRRLSRCQEVNDVYEIEEEMIDRFGSLDTNTKQFLSIIIAKILSAQKEIKSISSYCDNITFVYENDTKKLIKSKSKDEDDIIDTTLKYLRKKS